MSDNPSVVSVVPDTETKRRFMDEIRDAVELLDYAIAQGLAVADALVERIKKAQNYLADSAPWPSDAERADFETAYRDLAQFMQPITSATLRATLDRPGKNAWQNFFGASPAKRFSRRLYWLVILCVALMIASRIVVTYNPKVAAFGDPSMPFMYGLLDRKSTRLNSSHLVISYSLFCFIIPTDPQHPQLRRNVSPTAALVRARQLGR